jgi:hypothetical protein
MKFSSRRWNKTSNDIKSHVVSSKARKAIVMKSSEQQTNQSPSILNRLSTAVFGSSSSKPSDGEAKTSEKSTKRNYGFATRNLALYSDKNSEDLYRYKNLSSSYMRSSSPTRDDNDDEDKSAVASGSTEKKDKDKESDDSS